ncbi:MAG TPA: hypothetical protein VG651_24090 [Stellaceae bacterium]|nr:hypothetical protein [Stellaceae bacterium]
MRHAELRLASQTSSLQAFESRASALMGWIVTGVSAIGGAAVVALAGGAWFRAAAIGTGLIPALVGAVAVSAVLWPKNWHDPGYTPDIVMNTCESELQQLEYLVAGYATGISDNRRFLDRAGRLMRWAWWMLFAAPLTATALAAVTLAVV